MKLFENRWLVAWCAVVAIIGAMIVTMGKERSFACWGISGIVISCWHIIIDHYVHPLPLGSPASVLLDEGANWSVFLGLSFLFGNTLAHRRKSEPTAFTPPFYETPTS